MREVGHMQQLSSLTITLKPEGSSEDIARRGSLGPYLQGVLMEHVNPSYAELLHQLPFNPYSQYSRWEGERLIWKVCGLTDEATEHVVEPLRQLESVEIKRVNKRFDVESMSMDTLPLKVLANAINQPGAAKARIRFVTPTAFKSHGEYVIVPSIRLIVQNLLMHYGQVYDNNKEGYAETVEYVENHARVLAYSLRSNYFDNIAGQRKIPAFVGTMTIGLRGNDMTAGLVRMLLRFGEFAGVGIKTSMGMGGFKLLE